MSKDKLVTKEHITAQYELIDKAREFFENDRAASKWLSTTQKPLGWKKPLDVPFKAMQLLSALEHGVFL